MTGPRPHWLLCRLRRPGARLRMYCFPHSGGSAGEYLRWSGAFPGVELWGVQLPGRGGRHAEPPLTSMAQVVSALVSEVEFGVPFVLFGHSLGALIAYETAIALRERGLPQPAGLCLSAYGAPHLHEPGTDLTGLDGPALVEAIEREHGPLPGHVADDPELLELMLPVLRADLTIVSTYRHTPAEPLACPLVVLGGEGDRETGERLTAWGRYTTGPCRVRTFPGDHFYFRERLDDVLRHLATSLDELSAGAVPRARPLGPPASLS
ncbi:thioesterase II family protein [Nonomuraea lactucae]|uniref:thioesterase II family protein n=1 Tax=Nonomuraea lactucae TaxID=2249762 RepID=UPI000DE27955|nr:alpha/beta fold hydrolase [Nonomuraea lactucae]